MKIGSDSRILLVCAHPDDEVLGCGGTIAKAVAAGADVFVLFLGEGVSARFPVGQYESDEFRTQTEQRLDGAKMALAALGVSKVRFGTRLCCQFDTYPLLSLVKEIEQVIREFQPTILLTHSPVEVNLDHRATYRAVEAACRPASPNCPPEIYAFEIVCSGNWTFEDSFKPNVYIDVEKYWEKKMEAWHCYKGEDRPFPFPRSDIGITLLANFRGMACGLEKAEAFKLLRSVVR